MIGLETDHVILGPMRGLKINCIGAGQHTTHKVTDIATTRLGLEYRMVETISVEYTTLIFLQWLQFIDFFCIFS